MIAKPQEQHLNHKTLRIPNINLGSLVDYLVLNFLQLASFDIDWSWLHKRNLLRVGCKINDRCNTTIPANYNLPMKLPEGMKTLRTSGTLIPSSSWWFSSMAQMERVVAHMVAFNICTYSAWTSKI